jgi:hypothetical protein
MELIGRCWKECLLVPHLAEHALGWALVLNALATGRVGSVIGATLLCEDVVEKTTGGATTLAIERGLGAGGRRHDVVWWLVEGDWL